VEWQTLCSTIGDIVVPGKPLELLEKRTIEFLHSGSTSVVDGVVYKSAVALRNQEHIINSPRIALEKVCFQILYQSIWG
jgi:hypothetical protein